MKLKQHLQRLLAENHLEVAIQDALRHIEGADPLYAEAIQYSARWEAIESDIRTDQAPVVELRQRKNQLMSAFISFIQDLPDELELIPKETKEETETPILKRKGIREDRFKWHIFVGLLIVKGLILIYLFNIKQSGGFLTTQYKTLNGLMLPVFTASLILMAKHLWDHRRPTDASDGPYVNRGNQFFAYFALLAYTISILLAINTFSSSEGDFESLLGWVNGTEALLGGAIGYIVSTLFKKEDP